MGIYEGCKITRFWNSEKERESVLIKFPNGFKKIKFYSRYLMEVKLNRFLSYSEVVHHIDGNQLNDDIENLLLTTRGTHEKIYHSRPGQKFNCHQCGTELILKGKKLSSYLSRYNRGEINTQPFCSQSCVGSFSNRNNKVIEEKFICPTCGKEFILTGKQHESYRVNKKNKLNYAGPFCCVSCARVYASSCRRGKTNERVQAN